MRKQKINLPVKLLILGLVIFTVLFFIISYLAATLKSLDYFKIKEVVFNKSEGNFDFSYLIGRNIFNLDLRKESRYISELYPDYKKISLVRLLPDRLCIVFTQRLPLAYVKLYRYFYVDNEMVLFDIANGQAPGELPLIAGLEKKISGVKPGKRYNIKELAIALNIIRAARANILLKNYKIKRIDVADPANTTCFMVYPVGPTGNTQAHTVALPQVLEVRIGQNGVNARMCVLADLLNQLKKESGNIKYIDLRFKEPVIKFKDVQ
ncbi:MAG: cell division protein FtsQ/DivIB [Candidatus Omnitrophica bacterium]|nr:cell division protein FtsQ/DivIB [Candidatus Omnitrophota bacterium]MDD5592302.1 cell division protein FtsQ/DivIB [Candidatus Omnitrophota bacterium]